MIVGMLVIGEMLEIELGNLVDVGQIIFGSKMGLV